MIPILYDHAEKDFTSQGICRLADAVDCFVTEERNGIYECELKYPIDGLYFEEIFEGRLIGATHDDNGDIQPFEIYKHSAPIDGIVTFYAHHLSYRLRNHILVPFHASSCTEAMSVLKAKSMNNCPFNFFTDVGTLGNFDVEYPVSIKARLAGDGDSILNLYGPGEFKYDKWNVSFLEHRGVDHGVEIRYGKNLTDITREYDESEVYTAVVPYWFKEDSEGNKTLVTLDEYGVIVSESDAVQHIFWTNEDDEIIRDEQGHPIEFSSENMIYAPLDLTSEFDEAPTQAQLATRAKQLFEAAQPWLPEDNIKISFVALWQTPEYEEYAPLEKVSLCDIVHVIHTRIGVMVDAEVIKTVYNVLLDRYNAIELGSPQTSYADEIASDTQAALEEIQRQIRRSVTADYVNEQISSATDKITGGLGGYVKVTLNANGEPQEILVMDQPSIETAVNVIRINQAGIGFSTNGYQGPFNSAWLIDGTFDAQVINVINLAATVIRTGFLTDAQGYNYWNLETGEFRLSSTVMLDTYKETGYTATRDYKIGDKVEVQLQNDTFIYEVTSVIPKGSTIRPGVNADPATAHTLAEFARKAETIVDVDVEYAVHTSPSTAPDKDSDAWQTGTPTWEQGKYIWQRTRMRDGNNETHYSEPVCIQGARGSNSAIVYLYRRSASAVAVDWTQNLVYDFSTNKLKSLPTNWTDDLDQLSSGTDPIYMTAASAYGNESTCIIAKSEWSDPIILSENSKTSIVVLYKRSATTNPTKPTAETTYDFNSATLTPASALNGWSLDLPARDGNPCYAIQAVASGSGSTDKIPANQWSTPKQVLSDGANGQSSTMLYLYKRSKTNPGKPSESSEYSFSDHTLTPIPSGWSQTYVAGDNPLYVITYNAVSDDPSGTVTILGQEWSDPVILVQDGSAGASGKNTVVVHLYKRSTTPVTAIDWNYTLKYSFTENKLIQNGSNPAVPNGWSESVVDTGVDGDLYATAATVSSVDSTVDIPVANSWVTPVCIAKNGTNGLSWSSAAVFLYARAEKASDLHKPRNNLTYTFSTGILSRGGQSGPTVLEGWSQTIPASDSNKNPCFVIQAAAVSDDGQTDTILGTDDTSGGDWSDILLLVSDGADGLPGLNSATVSLYARAASASSLSLPNETLYYGFSTGKLYKKVNDAYQEYTPSPWSLTIPDSNGDPCFMTQATAVNSEDKDEISASQWVAIRKLVADGEDGRSILSVTEYYARSTNNSQAPASTDWGTNVPTLTEEYKYLWNYELITYSTYDSQDPPQHETQETAKRVIGVYGNTGASGRSIGSIENHYLATSLGSGVTKQTTGWSTEIQQMTPVNCFLWNYESIYDTATPEALISESDPTIIGVYGQDGDPGVGVYDIEEQYCLSPLHDPSNPPTTGWQATQPAWEQGWYIWTRSKITWTDIDSQTGVRRITYTTPILANAINGANEAVENLDDSLEQDEIFRRLTNNLNTEGVFLENGRLYLNATALAAGIIHDKGTIGGSTINVDSEDSFRASRDYTSGSYISVNGTIYKTTDSVLKGNPLSSSNISANCTRELSQLYSEVSKVATRAYSVDDYVRVGSVVYKVINSIPAGGNIVVAGSSDPGWPNVQQAYTNVYAEDSLVVSQWYFGSAYIAVGNELYHSTTGLNPGDRLNIYLLPANLSSSPTTLGTLYRNYWNLNTGYFQTASGKVGGFIIADGTSSTLSSTYSDLYYLSNNGRNWNTPYYAINTPYIGVGLRGAGDSSLELGYNVLSQGKMYVNNEATDYATRVRLFSGMIIFDVGTTPADLSNNKWTTASALHPYYRASKNEWAMFVNSGLTVHGTIGNYNHYATIPNVGRVECNELDGNVYVAGNLYASGWIAAGSGKPRLMSTKDYGNRALFCYETPSPMFGDIGEGEVGSDGLCYIWLEPIFAQTIADWKYQVFLQPYGQGNCYVKSRERNRFVVAGTPGLKFGWELKTLQADVAYNRLADPEDVMPAKLNPGVTIIEKEYKYLVSLREGRSK